MATVNIEFKPSKEDNRYVDVYVDEHKVFTYQSRDYFILTKFQSFLQDVYNLGYSAGIAHVQKPLEIEGSTEEGDSFEEDGWIFWDNSRNTPPLSDYTGVVVKYRDGKIEEGDVIDFYWELFPESLNNWNIVAYKVVGEGTTDD